jgi:hypothetical protein
MASANNILQHATSGIHGPLKMAVGTATMVAGTITIEAGEFGLSSIVHCFVFPWGISTGVGWIPGATNTFSAQGIPKGTNVTLELVEDDGSELDATNVCSVLVFGQS